MYFVGGVTGGGFSLSVEPLLGGAMRRISSGTTNLLVCVSVSQAGNTANANSPQKLDLTM
jgi:hypothetical protein